MRIDKILFNFPGILGVHDDVTVYRANDAEHDAVLFNLMRRSQEQGFLYNSTKCSIKQPQISFFGRTFSAEGMKPNPAKIQGILHLPTPKDTTQLQSFLGMVNFMQPFVPYLSHHTTQLYAILQKNATFDWTPSTNTEFQEIKSLLVNATENSLKYFN